MNEPELAEKFIDWLNDKNVEIFPEVPLYGSSVDIVVKSGIILTAIEVKTSFSFRVIEQAKKNLDYFHYSYIAIPKPKSFHFGLEICHMLGIGVLQYDRGFIEQRQKAKFQRKALYKYVKLHEYMKRSIAGSQNDRITPFKISIENIVRYIKRNPECTIKDCLENVDFHWSSISSAKNCIYQWIRRGVIKEFYIDNGKLYLNSLEQTEVGEPKNINIEHL